MTNLVYIIPCIIITLILVLRILKKSCGGCRCSSSSKSIQPCKSTGYGKETDYSEEKETGYSEETKKIMDGISKKTEELLNEKNEEGNE